MRILYDHLDEMPINKDCDAWLRSLMKKDGGRMLALRLIEVRGAYCREGFEWDSLKKASFKAVEEANVEILREGAASMLELESPPPAAEEEPSEEREA